MSQKIEGQNYPKMIEDQIKKITPRENIDTSIKEQWTHLDIGTSTFITCVIIFCICFNYLIPKSSKNTYIALIISTCITFIFPLSWIMSITNYPDKNTKYYVLSCLFLGIIFELVALIMTCVTTDRETSRLKKMNKDLSPQDLANDPKYTVSPTIVENNQKIYILFTSTIVLMIASISTYFYDEVTTEKMMISKGVRMKPSSDMGTNMHWWLTFLYEKANELDDWWHSFMEIIQIPAMMKLFLLFVIGFLTTFFIFADVNIVSRPSLDKPVNPDDYENETSLPNTDSPLKQDGIFLLYGKTPAPKRKSIVKVRYLPNTYTPEAYSDINLFVLLIFFTSLMASIIMNVTLSFLSKFISVFNTVNNLIASILSFGICFIFLYFYFPKGSNMTLLYLLITFVFAILATPCAIMIIEILLLLLFQTSISKLNGWVWIIFIVLFILTWMLTFNLNSIIFDSSNYIDNIDTNSNVLQIFTVILIALAVGWFFGISFHFDVFSFLFVLAFTPLKYVVKIFAPIAILLLSIIQVYLASNSARINANLTDG